MSSSYDKGTGSTMTASTAEISNADSPERNSEAPIRVEELLANCRALLAELEAFSVFVSEAKKGEDRYTAPFGASIGTAEHAVDLRQFQTQVVSELKSLQKLSEGDQNAEKTIHTLKSSNFPFYAAIWETAKGFRALVQFHKRFYWDAKPTRDSKKAAERRFALVDIIAQDGAEWIKVSTVTEHRLLFELAKAQWEEADSSDTDDEGENRNHGDVSPPVDFVERMDLVRCADDLQRAAQMHRVRYSKPKVRIVLPKISHPPPAQLSPLFNRLYSTGAVIDLGPQILPRRPLEELRKFIFPRLLPSPHPPLTDTINIDCTILLALVSDLSHKANHPILPTYNDAIKRQIELETREHLLPSSLWPAMVGKTLVCTVEAARRMKEIVDTIGTPNERARTVLLIGHDKSDGRRQSGDELRAAFASLSDYHLPSPFQLPIRIVPSIDRLELEAAIASNMVLPIAETVADELTEINRSVFLYGWVKGITTVSSNRAVAKWIESTVEKAGNGAVGPEIWLREPARSLLGKEKERRK